jgi:hypothetical protein
MAFEVIFGSYYRLSTFLDFDMYCFIKTNLRDLRLTPTPYFYFGSSKRNPFPFSWPNWILPWQSTRCVLFR